MFALITIHVILPWAATKCAPWPARLSNVRLDPLRPPLRGCDVKPDNAFYFIRQVHNITTGFPAADWTNFEQTGLVEGSYTNLSAWFELNSTNISLLQKASLVDTCQVATCVSFETPLTYLQPLRALSRTLCFNAEATASTNDWLEAFKSWRTVLIANAHVSRGGPLLNQVLMYADIGICCESIRRIALTTGIPITESRQLLPLLESTDNDMEPFSESLRYERLVVQDFIPKVYQEGASAFYIFTGEKKKPVIWYKRLDNIIRSAFPERMGSSVSITSNHIDDIYSRIIDIESNPNCTSRFGKEIVTFFQYKSAITFFNDPRGRIIARLTIPALSPSAYNRFLRANTELRTTRIHLAVQLYRKDHNGEIPDNLQVLVPSYLPDIPNDPFTENSNMSYRVSNGVWTVYSVGPDQKDDHGNFNYSTNRYDQADICYPSDEYQRKLQKFRDSH
jgi:hypothetical protein